MHTRILPFALAVAIRFAVPVSIGLAVTNVLVMTGCTGAPTNVATSADPASVQQALVAENRLALAIAVGQVSASISGSIEAPVSLRDMPNVEDDRPPVYLHAFKTTGELIRDAQISVYWKDEKSVAYVVDNVPAQYPTVLVATIEPGLVMRAVVPPASMEKPAMAQIIDAKSEMIVRKMTDQGMMPPVGVGGLASVLIQGGVNPLAAAEEAEKAAAEYETLANSEWGQDIPEARQLANDLRTLASIQRSLAPAEGGQYRIQFCGPFCDSVGNFFNNLFGGAQTVQQKVTQKKATNPPSALINDTLTKSSGSLGRVLENSLISKSANGVVAAGGGNVVAAGGGNVVAAGGGNVVAAGGGNVVAAGGGNVVAGGGLNLIGPAGGNVVAGGGLNLIGPAGGNVVAGGGLNLIGPAGGNMLPRVFKSTSTALMNLADLYSEGKALANEKLGVLGPQGQPFSEAEIAAALASGQGPYHTSCEDVSFDGTRQNCTTVVSPFGAQEVIITRDAANYEAFIRDFMAAHKAGDGARVKRMLDDATITAFNYLYDDDRWKSPIGTWRVRLVQDGGNSDLPAGYSLLSDSEVVIAAPGKSDQERLASGTFEGLVSAWLPDSGSERLDNFSLRFEWDKASRDLSRGLISGEDRGMLRVLHQANFSAKMDGSYTRITGPWATDTNGTYGRFEMIRGTANFTL